CQQFTTRLHQAGAPVAASDLHAFGATGACVASPPSPSDPVTLYVEMGDALADDAYPAAGIVDVGGGRVVQRFDGTPDGALAIVARSELHDNARNVDCYVAVAADDQRRCLPGGQIDTVFFADAACTMPIISASSLPGCTVPPTLPAEVTYGTRAYPVGASLSPAMIYDKGSDGSCSVIGPAAAGVTWFSLGGEIAASAYEPVTLHTD
ncbi:MAG TPA: hypothetical protein VGH63_13715, partial [Polyangia bacterium]